MTASTRKERWRPVRGYPGYEVSDLGRVRSWRRPGRISHRRRSSPLLRRAIPNPRTGYLYVMLSVNGKLRNRQVHIMVLEAFVGRCPSGHETRHVDGKITNNRLKNLAWGTRREQFEDQVRHGTDTRGVRNGAAKLSGAQVKTIRRLLAKGQKGVTIARRFSVSQATVTRIKKGHRYAYEGT